MVRGRVILFVRESLVLRLVWELVRRFTFRFSIEQPGWLKENC
jgi:hypothetical protein